MRVYVLSSIEVSSGVGIRIWEGLCLFRQSTGSLRLHWTRECETERVLAMPVLNKSLERVLERASEGFLIDYKSDASARFYTVRISPCHDIVKGGMKGIPWYTSCACLASRMSALGSCPSLEPYRKALLDRTPYRSGDVPDQGELLHHVLHVWR